MATELLAYVVLIGVLVASAVVDSEDFGAQDAWFLVTLLTIGYMVSRGLAKSGSRDFYDDVTSTTTADTQAATERPATCLGGRTFVRPWRGAAARPTSKDDGVDGLLGVGLSWAAGRLLRAAAISVPMSGRTLRPSASRTCGNHSPSPSRCGGRRSR